MLSVGPGGRAAASGAKVGGGLTVVPRASCSEIRCRPSSSEPGTAKEAEGDQGECGQRGSLRHAFPGVEGCAPRGGVS